MQCLHPVIVYPSPALSRGLSVPCGKCRHCLMAKRREWSLRCYHELQAWHGKACFVTLTYTDSTIPLTPYGPTLRKKHVQDWLKRVRKHIDELPAEYRSTAPDGSSLRYFLAGEYGEETQRPHYHAILFGINCSKSAEAYIRETWQNGFIQMNLANYETIKYVAAYIDKKTYDPALKAWHEEHGIEQLFSLKSKGLGKFWIDTHAKNVERHNVILPSGERCCPPRYYVERHNLDRTLIKNAQKDKSVQEVREVLGLDMSQQQLERYTDNVDTAIRRQLETLYQAQASSRLQRDRNIQSKQSLKKRDFVQ